MSEKKEDSKVKPGRSWTKIGIFQNWDEAHERRLQEQTECNDQYEVKIRLGGYGFAVLKRLKEEFVEKKNVKKRKKLSGKGQKQQKQASKNS
jgi:hypothetical protein